MMEDFANRVITERLERVNREIERTRADQSMENVHQLRVSIRRLQQALRLFREIVGKVREQQLRAMVKPALDAAGEVRNIDIALSLAGRARVEEKALVRTRLAKARLRYQRMLVGILPADGVR